MEPIFHGVREWRLSLILKDLGVPENRVYHPIRDHFDRTNDDFHNLMLEHSIFRQSHICPFSCWSSEDQNDIEADLRCILTQIEWGCGWFLSVRGGGKARVINPILVIFNDETKVCGKPRSFPETRMVYLWVLFHAFPQVYQFSSLAAQSWSSSVPWLKGFACCRISGLPALWVSHQVDMNFPLYFNMLYIISIYYNRWQHIWDFSQSRPWLTFPTHPPSQVAQRTWAAFGVLWNCLLLPLGRVNWWLGKKHHWPWNFFCTENGNGSNYCWFFKDRNYQCVCFWSLFSLVSWHFFRGPTRKRPRRLVVLTGPHWRKALWHQRDPNLTPRQSEFTRGLCSGDGVDPFPHQAIRRTIWLWYVVICRDMLWCHQVVTLFARQCIIY